MNARGSTLLETTIYLALFSLLLAGVLPTAFQLMRNAERDERTAAAREEAAFVDAKLYWAIAGATSVTATTTTELRITRDDTGPLTFTTNGTSLTMARGMAAATSLTAPSFTVAATDFSIDTTARTVTARFSLNGIPFTFTHPLPRTGIFPPLCAQP
jgi:type II secretory pathway pseudopilin PulG